MARGPAELYDAFYDALEKDYEWEARKVLRLARRPGRRPQSLLDVACGTGRHLEVFARSMRCVGVDRDPAMLAIARRRCDDARLVQADMSSLDVGERFDIVTCLFSSVAYMRTVADLRRAIRAMARHLEPGGVLVIEPWYEPDQWEVGHLAVLVVDEPDRKATRVSRATRRGVMSALDFEYLLADASGIHHFRDRHELRLFEWDQYLAAFEAAGLEVQVDDDGLWGRGLILGVSH